MGTDRKSGFEDGAKNSSDYNAGEGGDHAALM